MPSHPTILVGLLALAGCQAEAPNPAAPAPTAAPAPAASTAAPAPLVQLLYAGEVGPDAFAAGQRARMVAWTGAMAFTPDQLRSLLALTWEVRALHAADAADRAATGAREAAALVPVYEAITALYATSSTPSEAELAALRQRLQAARDAAYAGQDPATARFAHVTAALDAATAWVATLAADQQARLAECRFFLQHRLGPGSDPTPLSSWLGTASGGADFAALNTRERPLQGEMDLGGLWSGDRPDVTLRASALLLVALEEPGLPEAVEVRLGARAPGDYTAAIAPDRAPTPATPPDRAPTPTPSPAPSAPPR